MKKMEVGIIGLGKFGLQFGLTLTDLGHKVVGLDSSDIRVKAAGSLLARVYRGDGTDRSVLESLRFQDLDAVAVSVGKSMEHSVLAALNLHDMGVKNIVAKAYSSEHKEVLLRLGVHTVVQPEIDVAVQTAHRLNNPGMLDFLNLGGGVLLQEVTVKAWEGKTLADLNLTTNHGIMVVACKSVGEKEYRFVPPPRTPLQKGETLLLIGRPEAIQALVP